MRRFELGLKLWSTDVRHAVEARELVERGIFSYVELFSVPGSLEETLPAWRDLRIPFVIHAAHSMKGLNPAKRELRASNRVLADEAKSFADALSADRIVFHPGVGGDIEESVFQLRGFSDSRILVENKPRVGLDGSICVGWSPGEMRELLSGTGYGFCLDFGHAHCAAVSAGEDPERFIRSLAELSPTLFHMTDGRSGSITDRHDRYGYGDLPLSFFLSLVPDGARITDEGGRSIPDSLSEPEEDAAMLAAVDLFSRETGGIEMKRARPDDVEPVFELSNDPDVRAASFSSLQIPYVDHVSWFGRQLEDGDVSFFVFYRGKDLVGQIRFRREAEPVYTVSVSVSKTFRGSGCARPMMRAALLALAGIRGRKKVHAFIKPENTASIRYFQDLGFLQTGVEASQDRCLYVMDVNSLNWDKGE